MKRIRFTVKESTRLGDGQRIKYKKNGTDKIEYKYSGLQVSHNSQSFAKVQFQAENIAYDSTGRVKRILGKTSDIIDGDMNTATRTVNSVSGRERPVSNKKPQGELRRKRCENQSLSFGVSQSKAYHKAKHSN